MLKLGLFDPCFWSSNNIPAYWCQPYGNSSCHVDSFIRCCVLPKGQPSVRIKQPMRRPLCLAGLCNIEYPCETCLKLKSREISFVQNIHFNCQMVLKLCIEHGTDTAVLCANFENAFYNWARSIVQTRFPKVSVRHVSGGYCTASRLPECDNVCWKAFYWHRLRLWMDK